LNFDLQLISFFNFGISEILRKPRWHLALIGAGEPIKNIVRADSAKGLNLNFTKATFVFCGFIEKN